MRALHLLSEVLEVRANLLAERLAMSQRPRFHIALAAPWALSTFVLQKVLAFAKKKART